MKAQYSVPFCVALALFRDPEDPASFDAIAVDDPQIRAACRNVELRARQHPQDHTAWGAHLTVQLKDGREFAREGETFKGMAEID